MKDTFDFNEFMNPPVKEGVEEKLEETVSDLEVHKAVVEELAADKVKIEQEYQELKQEADGLKKRIEELETGIKGQEENLVIREKEIVRLKEENQNLVAKCKQQEDKISELETREFDQQERNPNALALLDREVELPDRFPGETRDHVIEVIREARDQAEKEGRLRKAQLLEGVLVSNEPNGGLEKRRKGLAKFFEDNGNILSGPVIEELKRCGIPHKEGETYLLPAEIIKRTY